MACSSSLESPAVEEVFQAIECSSPRISFSDLVETGICDSNVLTHGKEEVFHGESSSEFEFSMNRGTMFSVDGFLSQGRLLPLCISQNQRETPVRNSLPAACIQEKSNCIDGRDISNYSTASNLISSSYNHVEDFCPMSPKAPTCSATFKDLLGLRKQQAHNDKDGSSCDQKRARQKTSKRCNRLRMLFKSCDAASFDSSYPSQPLLSYAGEDGRRIVTNESNLPPISSGDLTIFQIARPIEKCHTSNKSLPVSLRRSISYSNDAEVTSLEMMTEISSRAISVSRNAGCDGATVKENVRGFVRGSGSVSGTVKCSGRNSEESSFPTRKCVFSNSQKQCMKNIVPKDLGRRIRNSQISAQTKYEMLINGKQRDRGRQLERSTSYSSVRVLPMLHVPPIYNTCPARKLEKGPNHNGVSDFNHHLTEEKATKGLLPGSLRTHMSLNKDV